jgi:NAD(P)H-hydrate epimerase
MMGSAVLASLGALRAGAALCTIAAPEPLLPHMLAANPSATGLALPVGEDGQLIPSAVAALLDTHGGKWKSLAIGPGLGTGFAAQQIVLRLVAQENHRPMVIDADALNCLSMSADFAKDFRARAVLTPHPLEYARLAKALEIQSHVEPPAAPDRKNAAERLAQRLGAVVVLKGHGTVVTDGARTWVCARGNDALAIGGSGDVLTGITAGMLAQFPGLGVLECACLAVEAHARAAEVWVARAGGTAGLLAAELAAEVPNVLPQMAQSH